MIKRKTILVSLLVYALLSFACIYIVIPEDLATPEADVSSESRIWSALVTGVSTNSEGDLHVDITIRNDTGDWSTMQAVSDKLALLIAEDGKTTQCSEIFINTGGHRLAPGFQMRGYTTGKKTDLKTQLLYIECNGATSAPGARLKFDYVSYGGDLDYYEPELNEIEGTIELNLDEVVSDLKYPIATPIESLIHKKDETFLALSDNQVSLLDISRTDEGFDFLWQNFNPTKFALKTHIGTPPVIGNDGIIYGYYESMDIAPIPLTPANEKMEWSTSVAVPTEVNGLYILLSVESKKPRTYANYVVDISDK
jgi:hypothetical protein